jgi:hypothetical protein
VKLFEPIEGVCYQKVFNFGAPEIENVGTPVWVLAALWIGMLVKCLTVEPSQRPIVFRKVRGNPVENYAYVSLVKPVDQVAKVVWAAES